MIDLVSFVIFILSMFEEITPDTTAELVLELRMHTRSDREMFAALQSELRYRALRKMRVERPDHTLGPTALVNEAFLRLFQKGTWKDHWESDAHAIHAISLAMQRVLLDHAEAYSSKKRGGSVKNRVPLDQEQAAELGDGERPARVDEELLVAAEQVENVLAVRGAIEQLNAIAPRQAEVVRLQFYGGLTQEEIAGALDVSVETVKLDWRKAKGFLRLVLEGGSV